MAENDKDRQEQMPWYNFQTREMEYHPSGWARQLTPKEAIAYIPNIASAHGLFRCRIGLGDSVLNALIAVLSAVVDAHKSEAS